MTQMSMPSLCNLVLEFLQAEVVSSGNVTAVSREIDFAIVSKRARHLVTACGTSDNNVFATHSSFYLNVSRHWQDYCVFGPSVPKKLPRVDKAIQHADESLDLWHTLVKQHCPEQQCDPRSVEAADITGAKVQSVSTGTTG